ncbi:HAD-IIIC family phosphatase [Flavobacteriales bacterium]|nr:HAD-IIIC family phosphatase [Flavobacteriales bacterium]
MELLLTSNHSTQFIARELRQIMPNEVIREADYDSILPSLFSAVRPEHIWVLLDSLNLRNQFFSLKVEERADFGITWINQLRTGIDHVGCQGGRITLTLPPLAPDGCAHAILRPDQIQHHIRAIREGLLTLTAEYSHVLFLDLQSLISEVGRDSAYDNKLRNMADHPYSLKFTRILATKMAALHDLANGRVQKCCILDLDHTLWGGVIGDDGLDGIQIGRDGIGKAYREIQLWARELRRRGIILAICSKNTEHIAREPFQKHPDMVLREEDIAVFVANWEDKASNIRYIQEVLNIGFDSMVFIDDNPMERAIVREHLPEVMVPELPEAPEDYLQYLERLDLFNALSKVSIDSVDRTKQYQIEAQRVKEQKSSGSLDEFLSDLSMAAKVKTPFASGDVARISELYQRSNQFNLTTIRYSEADVRELIQDSAYLTFSFRLEDKFGEHGIVSLVVAKITPFELQIESWVMSCRVLKRTLEHFVMNTLVQAARWHGCNRITGTYRPTPKNGLVKDLFPQLGFNASQDGFMLDLSPDTSFPSHITKR